MAGFPPLLPPVSAFPARFENPGSPERGWRCCSRMRTLPEVPKKRGATGKGGYTGRVGACAWKSVNVCLAGGTALFVSRLQAKLLFLWRLDPGVFATC